MSVDWPRGWEIAKSVPFKKHHPECSYRVTKGCIICDCDILNKHPEMKSCTFYGSKGIPIKRKK